MHSWKLYTLLVTLWLSTGVRPLLADSDSAEWTFSPADFWGFRSAPLVHDGRVYIGSLNKTFYCLDAETGAVVWQRPLGGRVTWSTPAREGKVIAVGCEDGKVYAFSTAAEKPEESIWTTAVGARVDGSPAAGGGRFYVGSMDKKVYALSASDGKVAWTFNAEDEVFGQPLLSDGKVYFGAGGFDGKTVYCLDAAKGGKLFSTEVGTPVYSSLLRSGDHIVFGTQGGKLMALDSKDGAPAWSLEVKGAVFGSAVLAGNTIIFGSQESKIHGVDARSHKGTWEFSTTLEFPTGEAGVDNKKNEKRYYPTLCRPTVRGGDVVFALAYGIFCLDGITGKQKWRKRLANPVDAPSVTLDDNHVYVATRLSLQKWRID